MLMRCTRAYSSSCSQVVLIYLHPFRRNSRFCSKKIAKKITKTPLFRVQSHSRSLMATFLKSSSPVLVVISSMSVPICYASQQRLNNHFLEGYPTLTPACTGPLKPRGSGLWLLKSTFNTENFICRLSWSISSHFGAIHSWKASHRPKSQKIH